MPNTRLRDLQRFYDLLAVLEVCLGGCRSLAACRGHMNWPQRGVYFFFEGGEQRSHSGAGPRVVRIGTHALTSGSGTTLWQRLSQHQGVLRSGGGNHRGSIFRLLVGTALAARDGNAVPSWGQGSSADRNTRTAELGHEQRVSAAVGAMPFLWLGIDDVPSVQSLRGVIERNAIALLSNYKRPALDPPSPQWLGEFCDRERVRQSGLWNQRHVDEHHDPAFLDTLAQLIEQTKADA